MGIDNYLYLFDPRTYERRLIPAYRSFLDLGHTEPLIALLKEVIRSLPSNEGQLAEGLQSAESYQEDIEILEGLGKREGTRRHPNALPAPKQRHSRNRRYVSESIVPDLVIALCVPRDRGVIPQQQMESALALHQKENPEWIEDLLSGVQTPTGGVLEVSLGEGYTEIFSRQDLETLAAELDALPPLQPGTEQQKQSSFWEEYRRAAAQSFPPGSSALDKLLGEIDATELKTASLIPEADASLAGEYDNLRRMVRIAAADQDLTLLLVRS
jgi:hypothetical protein